MAAKGVGKRLPRLVAGLAEPELTAARLVMPAAQVRRLVSQIILADEVAPFVRRMVAVGDALRAGRTAQAARAARQRRSRPRAELTAAILSAAERGRLCEAEQTAFYAASYAYRNSLDYFLALLAYLDGFRPAKNLTRRGARV